MTQSNVDQDEIAKFEKLAARWWDPNSEFKPLHDINPLRLDYIDRLAGLAGKRILDIGCATGRLLAGLESEGWTVRGVEICKPAAEYGIRNHGVPIHIQVLQLQAIAQTIRQRKQGPGSRNIQLHQVGQVT